MRDEIAKIIWDRHYYRSLNGARDTADQILALMRERMPSAEETHKRIERENGRNLTFSETMAISLTFDFITKRLGLEE